jgi:hypothetical protein
MVIYFNIGNRNNFEIRKRLVFFAQRVMSKCTIGKFCLRFSSHVSYNSCDYVLSISQNELDSGEGTGSDNHYLLW